MLKIIKTVEFKQVSPVLGRSGAVPFIAPGHVGVEFKQVRVSPRQCFITCGGRFKQVSMFLG